MSEIKILHLDLGFFIELILYVYATLLKSKKKKEILNTVLVNLEKGLSTFSLAIMNRFPC